MQQQYKISDYALNGSYKPGLDAHEVNHAPGYMFGISKRSFLVFRHNKYMIVPTENIAFFYVKYESTVIVTLDKQEYSISYSLEQVQHLLSEHQFFRLNRQYLVNVNAIKEVEHYFARKLLVIPTVPFHDKLIVSKEKASNFLDWLENR